MTLKSKAVILFTRVPLPGETKTRLHPFLTGEQCASLQEAFIRDVYNEIKDFDGDIFISYTPGNKADILKKMVDNNACFIPQKGNDLGERMNSAINSVLEKYRACVLIGSDVPLISIADIDEAFNILESKDVVISPTLDGGYYLIGMKSPCDSIFNISYGTDTVFASTEEAVRQAGKSHGVGRTLFDIDEKKDLLMLIDYLRENLQRGLSHTRKDIEDMEIRLDGDLYDKSQRCIKIG
jgi:hypothetical protein